MAVCTGEASGDRDARAPQVVEFRHMSNASTVEGQSPAGTGLTSMKTLFGCVSSVSYLRMAAPFRLHRLSPTLWDDRRAESDTRESTHLSFNQIAPGLSSSGHISQLRYAYYSCRLEAPEAPSCRCV